LTLTMVVIIFTHVSLSISGSVAPGTATPSSSISRKHGMSAGSVSFLG
jgi:hypothetical protein